VSYLEIRETRLSLKRDISDIFTSGSILSTVYNVYGEDTLRAGTAPTEPYVYILDADVRFEQKHLPVIVLVTSYSTKGFELGSDPQSFCVAEVYIMGRNRGERDDFAAAIIKNVKAIHIRNFDVAAQTLLATVPLEPFGGDEYWRAENFPITEELRTEGSLLNGIILTCQFWVFQA
jgi:hypothetical protein